MPRIRINELIKTIPAGSIIQDDLHLSDDPDRSVVRKIVEEPGSGIFIIRSVDKNGNTVAPGTGNVTLGIDPSVISTGGGTSVGLISSFVVGESGMASNSSSFSNAQLNGLLASQLQVFVDGFKVIPGRIDRFSYSLANGTITFTAPLDASTTVEIYATTGTVTPLPAADGQIMANDTDALLINQTDSLIF